MTDNLHYYMYLIFGMFVRDAIDGDGNNKWNVAPPPDPRLFKKTPTLPKTRVVNL